MKQFSNYGSDEQRGFTTAQPIASSNDGTGKAMKEIKYIVEINVEEAVNAWATEIRAELERRKYDRRHSDCIVKHNANICFGLELSLAIMNQKLNAFIEKGAE